MFRMFSIKTLFNYNRLKSKLSEKYNFWDLKSNYSIINNINKLRVNHLNNATKKHIILTYNLKYWLKTHVQPCKNVHPNYIMIDWNKWSIQYVYRSKSNSTQLNVKSPAFKKLVTLYLQNVNNSVQKMSKIFNTYYTIGLLLLTHSCVSSSFLVSKWS